MLTKILQNLKETSTPLDCIDVVFANRTDNNCLHSEPNIMFHIFSIQKSWPEIISSLNCESLSKFYFAFYSVLQNEIKVFLK